MPHRASRPIRTVIVNPKTLVRDSLRLALEPIPDVEVIGAFADGEELVRAVVGLAPDVAVVDLELIGGNGVQLAARLKRTLPLLGVVLVVDEWGRGLLASLAADEMRRSVYVLDASSQNVTALVRAIKISHAKLLDVGSSPKEQPNPDRRLPPPNLTPRQREVLGLLARGLSNRGIAEVLHLKEKTIENQVAIIYDRLQLDHRPHVHLRVLAARHADGADIDR